MQKQFIKHSSANERERERDSWINDSMHIQLILSAGLKQAQSICSAAG